MGIGTLKDKRYMYKITLVRDFFVFLRFRCEITSVDSLGMLCKNQSNEGSIPSSKLFEYFFMNLIQLEILEMEMPTVFWNRIVNFLREINDGKIKILVCTRSIMVLVYNLVKGNRPILGHGYKHVKIENCDTIAFSVDASFENIQLICEMTSEGLQ